MIYSELNIVGGGGFLLGSVRILKELFEDGLFFIRIMDWYKNKGQWEGIDSLGIPVKSKRKWSLSLWLCFAFILFYFIYFFIFFPRSTESALLERKETDNLFPFPSLYLISLCLWGPDEWIRGRKDKRTRYNKCVLTWVAELELHGSSLLSIIKHSSFLSTKHERTNNKQPHRSDRERERFSQPEAGLQGYMLYLIPRTPHRPWCWKNFVDVLSCLQAVCVCVCECVCATSSLEPQLNLSDISSHVLFPYYKGPNVTQCVRAGTTVSHTHTHTHTHAH